MSSIISKFGSELNVAAAALRATGMPLQLLQQTGHTALELSSSNGDLGHGTPWSIVVTDMEEMSDLVLVSLSISCIRNASGEAAPYGSVDPKKALAQKEANPAGLAQWFGLNCRVAIPVPPGQDGMFNKALDYFQEAREQKVPLSQRKEECRIWLTGCVKFTVAPGGKYGCIVDAIDLTDATFNGSGSGSEPIASTVLVSESVVDVSALFSAGAPGAATATSATVATGSRRRR